MVNAKSQDEEVKTMINEKEHKDIEEHCGTCRDLNKTEKDKVRRLVNKWMEESKV